MSVNIVVPELGESVVEATVLEWRKQEGERVAAGETVVELETEKVNLQVSAPKAGVLARIEHRAGEDVKIGEVLGVIEERVSEGNGQAAKSEKREAKSEKQEVRSEKREAEAPGEAPRGAAESVKATPVAERIAIEYGIDLKHVPASAADGRITKQDVEDYLAREKAQPAVPANLEKPVIAAPPPSTEKRTAEMPAPRTPVPPPPAPGTDHRGREERVRMSRRRQTIARRLVEAHQTAAMLTTFNEVDMTGVMELRARYKDVFEKKHGVKLGFMGFFVKACCRALEEIPAVNAEIDGADIVYKHFCHMGVAVGTEKGLVVPVVRDADRLGIAEIEKEIARLGKKARDGALDMTDLQGGTFTISNGGIYGSLMSTPILNAPQSGILGMHKIQERPVVVAGKIEIRPMMYLALSYDHRIVDGKEAVTFLVRVKESLEDPARIVLDL